MALDEHAGLVGEEVPGGQAELEKGQWTLEELRRLRRLQVRCCVDEEPVGHAPEEQCADADAQRGVGRVEFSLGCILELGQRWCRSWRRLKARNASTARNQGEMAPPPPPPDELGLGVGVGVGVGVGAGADSGAALSTRVVTLPPGSILRIAAFPVSAT